MTAYFVVPSLALAAAGLAGVHALFTRTPARKEGKR